MVLGKTSASSSWLGRPIFLKKWPRTTWLSLIDSDCCAQKIPIKKVWSDWSIRSKKSSSTFHPTVYRLNESFILSCDKFLVKLLSTRFEALLIIPYFYLAYPIDDIVEFLGDFIIKLPVLCSGDPLLRFFRWILLYYPRYSLADLVMIQTLPLSMLTIWRRSVRIVVLLIASPGLWGMLLLVFMRFNILDWPILCNLKFVIEDSID